MDMAKYFDTLSLDSLRTLCISIGAPQDLLNVLDLYAKLDRLLFVNSCPFGLRLTGDFACGIPQGCPLACTFANIAGGCLEHFLQQQGADTGTSYLDDRIFMSDSADELEFTLHHVELFDNFLGVRRNPDKCHYAIFGAHSPEATPMGPQLASIPFCKSSFPYLGVDIAVGCKAPKTLAKARIKDFATRASLARSLCSKQRHWAIADACSSLWLPAGSRFSSSELETLHSWAAAGMRPRHKTHGQTILRARHMEHLATFGAHATSPPIVAIYSIVLQIHRQLKLSLLDKEVWEQLWVDRHRVINGPMALLRNSLDKWPIDWVAPFVLKTDTLQLDFSDNAVISGKGKHNW